MHRKIISILIISVILSGVVLPGFTQETDSLRVYNEVQLALIQGDLERSQGLLEGLKDQEYMNPLFWYYKGMVFKQGMLIRMISIN